jgi:hypothetical protein
VQSADSNGTWSAPASFIRIIMNDAVNPNIRLACRRFGESEGTSLVIVPQQFSHCLKASDRRVRIVRANLISTGVIFSGFVDTDISFGYGMFSPGCRRADLADVKRLGIALSGNAGKPGESGWDDVMKRLHAALAAIR